MGKDIVPAIPAIYAASPDTNHAISMAQLLRSYPQITGATVKNTFLEIVDECPQQPKAVTKSCPPEALFFEEKELVSGRTRMTNQVVSEVVSACGIRRGNSGEVAPDSSQSSPSCCESKGSVDHPHDCKPCAWFYREEGCLSGADCQFCHLCPPGELQRRRKEKSTALKATVYASPAEKAYRRFRAFQRWANSNNKRQYRA